VIKANRADMDRIRRWERKQARERERKRIVEQCFMAEYANMRECLVIHMRPAEILNTEVCAVTTVPFDSDLVARRMHERTS
jgi:hypothetical protein